jgi:hypothetical protein
MGRIDSLDGNVRSRRDEIRSGERKVDFYPEAFQHGVDVQFPPAGIECPLELADELSIPVNKAVCPIPQYGPNAIVGLTHEPSEVSKEKWSQSDLFPWRRLRDAMSRNQNRQRGEAKPAQSRDTHYVHHVRIDSIHIPIAANAGCRIWPFSRCGSFPHRFRFAIDHEGKMEPE